MVFYIVSIVGGDALIILVNYLVNLKTHSLSTIYIVLAGLIAGIGVIAIDAVSATFVRRCLPEKWFGHNVKFHKIGKKECAFYEKCGIKLWKDKILELGVFTSFSKKHVADPNSSEYLERFILECNYGYVIHFVGIFLGYLLLLVPPLSTTWRFSVPAATINAFLNLLPFMILRYNLPRLERMRALAEKKEARATREAAQAVVVEK